MKKEKLKRSSRACDKPMIIILEGPCGVGKDTVELEIHKQTNYKHVIINRHLASSYVYAKLHKRKNWEKNCKEYLRLDKIWAKRFKNRVYIAFLSAKKWELKKRLKKRNDLHINENSNKVFALFMEYLEKSKMQWCWIDTTHSSPKRIATVITNCAERRSK